MFKKNIDLNEEMPTLCQPKKLSISLEQNHNYATDCKYYLSNVSNKKKLKNNSGDVHG